MSNNNVAQYVMLAEANYADFSSARSNDGSYDSKKVLDALTGDKNQGGIGKPEQFADLVTQNYEVVTHYADRDKGWKEFTYFLNGENGFSGTLFKGTGTQEKGGNAGMRLL